jgi:hypothetical protein
MNGLEIASVVLNALGNIAPLAAKLISGEDSAKILADMRAEIEKAADLLRAGGAMDDAFAVSDAKLDAAIKAAEEKTQP